MSARAPTDGWPYITLEVNGIPLPFKHLAMPGARRNLKNALVLAQAEGLELVQAATAEGATDHDRAQVERATLLIEGSVGAYLMPLWAGPRMPTQDKVEADEAAEPTDLHFKGADHKEAAGLAFAADLCESYGVAFEHLAQCVRILSDVTAPGARDPSGKEVAEVVRVFPVQREATT